MCVPHKMANFWVRIIAHMKSIKFHQSMWIIKWAHSHSHMIRVIWRENWKQLHDKWGKSFVNYTHMCRTQTLEQIQFALEMCVRRITWRRVMCLASSLFRCQVHFWFEMKWNKIELILIWNRMKWNVTKRNETNTIGRKWHKNIRLFLRVVCHCCTLLLVAFLSSLFTYIICLHSVIPLKMCFLNERSDSLLIIIEWWC